MVRVDKVLLLIMSAQVRKGRRTLSVAKAEAKREVAANSEEVKLIEDERYKTKLTPPVDTRENTLCLLCLLSLYVLCWVFMCASFVKS